jgi:hypothetical protein
MMDNTVLNTIQFMMNNNEPVAKSTDTSPQTIALLVLILLLGLFMTVGMNTIENYFNKNE